uniref:Uncharacterized protein n=1 Tax=Arundo donax TaxID=35708 RepID=A0A0A9C2D1_ARUDO
MCSCHFLKRHFIERLQCGNPPHRRSLTWDLLRTCFRVVHTRHIVEHLVCSNLRHH